MTFFVSPSLVTRSRLLACRSNIGLELACLEIAKIGSRKRPRRSAFSSVSACWRISGSSSLNRMTLLVTAHCVEGRTISARPTMTRFTSLGFGLRVRGKVLLVQVSGRM